jgi:hypothetical protein
LKLVPDNYNSTGNYQPQLDLDEAEKVLNIDEIPAVSKLQMEAVEDQILSDVKHSVVKNHDNMTLPGMAMSRAIDFNTVEEENNSGGIEGSLRPD